MCVRPGMKHIFDGGTAMVTVLKFGHHRSDLLAWGCNDGRLRIGVLGDEPRLLQVTLSIRTALASTNKLQGAG